MRVLAATPLYPPESLVGAWLATHRFLAHLAARGHEVHAMTMANPRPSTYTLDGVHVGGDHDIDMAVAVADVVISHLGDNGKPAKLAAKWRKPLVRMVHGHDPHSATKLTHHGEPALVVYNAHHLAATVGYPGIVAHPPTTAVDATPGGAVTQINMSEPKGGRTFWKLAAEHPHREFLAVIGGYGPQVLERHRHVEVVAPTPDVAEIYRRTRVLLIPSAFESWGMVGVEAMSCGIPIIAHRSPGLAESLGDVPIYVDRDDAAGWSAALDRLDDPDEWTARADAGRARFAGLDLTAGLDRFADAVEGLVV